MFIVRAKAKVRASARVKDRGQYRCYSRVLKSFDFQVARARVKVKT